MKEIPFDRFGELLQAGLEEEVQFTGRIVCYPGEKIHTQCFAYQGRVSMKPSLRASREARGYLDLVCGDAVFSFRPRQGEEIFVDTSDRGEPNLIIYPIDITDEASLHIVGPTDIKY